MKNIEVYESEIKKYIDRDARFGVLKICGALMPCCQSNCERCLLSRETYETQNCCEVNLIDWLMSEYKEQEYSKDWLPDINQYIWVRNDDNAPWTSGYFIGFYKEEFIIDDYPSDAKNTRLSRWIYAKPDVRI